MLVGAENSKFLRDAAASLQKNLERAGADGSATAPASRTGANAAMR